MLNPDDPYAGLDPYRLRPGQLGQITPLQPEEEQSLLGKITGGALGGLGYAGGVLEKTFGGRALRGILGGNPRELLSILPGSDTLGITDENDRVSGKDLLANVGLLDRGDDSWLGTIGGMATELALDPGMYLTFGGAATSKAGQVAGKLGMAPKTATSRVTGTLGKLLDGASPELMASAERAAGGAENLAGMMHEPLGGLVGVGLPFGKPSALLGTGQQGADVLAGAGKVLSSADAGLRGLPAVGGLYGGAADLVGKGIDLAGRYGKAVFDPSVMGATSRVGQEAAGEAHAAIKPMVARYLEKAAKYGEGLKEAGVDPSGEILRAVLEGTHQGPVHPAVEATAKAMGGDLQEILQGLQGKGVNLGELQDIIGYSPRQSSPLARPTKGYGRPQQPLIATDPRVSERQDILKGFTGGTGGVNAMILDPEVYSSAGRDLTPLEMAAVIRRKYLDPSLAQEAAIPQSSKLADWVRSLDPQYRASTGTANPLKFFGNHPLADYADYVQRVSGLNGAAEATQNLLARAAMEAAPGQQLPQGARNLISALEDVKLTGPGAQDTLRDRLNALRAEKGLAPASSLADFHVPADTLGEASRYLRGFTTPDAVGNIGAALNAVTNLTKAGQTAPWPAFHARNFASGLWQNWVKGAGNAEGGLVKQVKDAYNLVKGGVIADANKVPGLEGLTAEQATKQLAQEMYAHGVGGHLPHIGREVVGPSGGAVNLGPDLGGFLARIPGEEPKSVGAALSAGVPRSLEQANPLNIAGVGSTQDLFAPVAGGRQLGDVVEGVNRGSLYLSLRRQGYTPEAAAKSVLESHFDYSPGAKTATESKLLGKLFPFYTYTRQNIPHQIRQLAENPGGAAATVARVSHDLRDKDTFLPDYLGSGLAIPTGKEDDGTQRFLTRLDLPPEQAFELLHGGPNAGGGSLMAALGQLNPLLKGPLEYATGKQFFTGRDIPDLYSQTGSPVLDQLLANSPLSRAATTVRTLADERKWASPTAALAQPINLLTGARVSDVDMQKQRTIAEREYLAQLLRGHENVGSFSTVYPKVDPSLLTPEELELLRLNKTVEARTIEAAKEKKRIRVE